MRPIDADALKELLLKERDAIPKTVTAPYYEFSVQKPNHTGDLVRGGIKKALRCMENTPTLTLDDKEREKRSRGCEYCAYECFLQDSEDMEITLYNHTDGVAYDVYPNFCPMCGRPLEGGGK